MRPFARRIAPTEEIIKATPFDGTSSSTLLGAGQPQPHSKPHQAPETRAGPGHGLAGDQADFVQRGDARDCEIACSSSRARVVEERLHIEADGGRGVFQGWETVPVRVVVQRVSRASVAVGGEVVGAIGHGLLALVGIAAGDTAADAERLAAKVARLRIFESSDGKFDLSVLDTGGAILVVSQFTLLADTTKGNRPGFSDAARPEVAEPLVDHFRAALFDQGISVASGVFGARMSVELVNNGPVTIVLG